MEFLFLSATLVMPAIAVGLHLKHQPKRYTVVLDAAPTHADQPQAVHARSAEAIQEALDAAIATMEEEFATILSRLDRIESKIDMLPERTS